LSNLKEEIQARYRPVILVLRRLRQEDGELEASLTYIARPCLKT
jgi:hypothetical protein